MTEITKTIPNGNPADAETLDGLIDLLTDKISLNLEIVCPGIVQSYNKATNRAVIKPAITGVASQGQKVSKEPLIDIPVLRLSGGGCTLSFPLKEKDTGWLIACDRNISIFKQNLTESSPNTYRKHRYLDAFFIPDAINGIGTDVFTIQTESQKFTVGDDEIFASALTVGNGATGNITDSNGKVLAKVEAGIITEIY